MLKGLYQTIVLGIHVSFQGWYGKQCENPAAQLAVSLDKNSCGEGGWFIGKNTEKLN